MHERFQGINGIGPGPPNLRLKLSGWGGHIGRRTSILIVAAPARSLSAMR
jgi:hypothetical protein